MPIEETMKEQIRLVLEAGDFRATAGMAAAAAAYFEAMGDHTFLEVSDEERARIARMNAEEPDEVDEAAEQEAQDAIAFAKARERVGYRGFENAALNIVALQQTQESGDRKAP